MQSSWCEKIWCPVLLAVASDARVIVAVEKENCREATSWLEKVVRESFQSSSENRKVSHKERGSVQICKVSFFFIALASISFLIHSTRSLELSTAKW